jgi:hypothetical protein
MAFSPYFLDLQSMLEKTTLMIAAASARCERKQSRSGSV